MKHYRYEDYKYYLRNDVNSYTMVRLLTYYVIKETACGYWIYDYPTPNFSKRWGSKDSRKRWVSKDSVKRFAYPTKAEAIASFKVRKRKQLMYAQETVCRATAALAEIEKIDKQLKEN